MQRTIKRTAVFLILGAFAALGVAWCGALLVQRSVLEYEATPPQAEDFEMWKAIAIDDTTFPGVAFHHQGLLLSDLVLLGGPDGGGTQLRRADEGTLTVQMSGTLTGASPDRVREFSAGWPLRCVAMRRHERSDEVPFPAGVLLRFDAARIIIQAGVTGEFNVGASHAAVEIDNTGQPLIVPIRPRPLALLIDGLVWGGILWLLWSMLLGVPRAVIRRFRRRAGRCPTCGYILAAGSRCSECGWMDSTRTESA